MTSFNTGTSADSGGSQTTSQAITIPAGVLAGDVVLVLAEQVTLTSTPSTFTASSTGTTPLPAGPPATGTEALPAAVTGQVFKFTASGTDAGKVITITASAGGFWAVGLVAYTGAGDVDVIAGAFGGAGSTSVTCPTLQTGIAGDWAVFLGGGAGENSTAVTPPSGSTLRVSDNSSSQIDAIIADSNASVGTVGTSIGGGTFNSPPSSTNCILTAFTVGLAPPHGAKQPRGLRGPAAAGRSRLTSARAPVITAAVPTTPAPFFAPHSPLRPAPAAAQTGHLTRGIGAPGHPAPFTVPRFPLRGPGAARPGRLAQARGLVTIPPSFPAPFFPPHSPVRGRAAAVSGKLASARGLVTVPPPFVPRGLPPQAPDDKSYIKKLLLLG